ncbi:MAG: citF 2 [Anaerospora sp.]|nr:citF 2 [Anaerospora sp.]
MINTAGRVIPETITGIAKVKPYAGPFAYVPEGRLVGPKIRASRPKSEKLLKSIDQAIDASGLQDGMTISLPVRESKA